MARWGGRRSRDVPFTISLKGGCRVELRLDVSLPIRAARHSPRAEDLYGSS